MGSRGYWSGTGFSAGPDNAWYFDPSTCIQDTSKKNGDYNAIAVRPGDVSIAVAPEPMSMVLFSVGGVVMAARRKLLRRRG